jgi:hypothetical protein
MSAQDNEAEDTAGDKGRASEQTDRAAKESNQAGSYSPERFPEDPEPAAPPLDNEHASEPPRSD